MLGAVRSIVSHAPRSIEQPRHHRPYRRRTSRSGRAGALVTRGLLSCSNCGPAVSRRHRSDGHIGHRSFALDTHCPGGTWRCPVITAAQLRPRQAPSPALPRLWRPAKPSGSSPRRRSTRIPRPAGTPAASIDTSAARSHGEVRVGAPILRVRLLQRALGDPVVLRISHQPGL